MPALENPNLSKECISARSAVAVAPSDVNELPYVTRAVYVGVTGDLAVVFADLTDAITFKAVPAGTLLDICVRKIMNTGTTAASIVALF